MQINRLFEIIYVLLGKNGATARELAERFEVSTRTIYRDIDVLSAAGIPVYTAQGTGGGIFLHEDFVLNKSVLTAEEQSQILIALSTLSVTGHPENDRLLSRLGGLFQKNRTDWIEVDFSRWGRESEDGDKFQLLRDAILRETPVAFHYFGTSGSSSHRVVTPWKLLFKSNAWYLQAFCHDRSDFRLFKLTRMEALHLAESSAEQPPRSPLPPAPSVTDAPQSPAPAYTTVRIRFHPQVAYRLFDEFYRQDIQRDEDGYYLATMHLPEDNWIYGYVLSFGGQAEILSPPHMRERICSILKKTLEIYST